MTKAELIEKIARSRELPLDVTKKCIGQILDLAFEELGAYFVRARVTRTQCPRFTFPAFGTFTKKKRSARKGINPRTLEPMTIDAAYTIDFRPGTELRQNLNVRAAPASAAKGKRRGAAQPWSATWCGPTVSWCWPTISTWCPTACPRPGSR